MSTPTVYELRRTNLIRLTEGAGAKTALAIKLDMTPAQVSHWLRTPGRKGSRVIHEDHARRIEAVLGLAPGTLDVAPGQRRPDIDPGLLALATRAVFEEAREAGLRDPDVLADLVAMAYAHARTTGQVDRSFVRGLITARC